MRSFEYAGATDIADALRLLDDGATARPLAGGTDLLPLMKADIVQPTRLVDVKRLTDLPSGIAVRGGAIEIGALTSLAEIEQSELLRQRLPMLGQAAEVAATPQLRNMATIGGNLLQRPRCWYFRGAQFPCWLKGGGDCPARDGENQQHALFGGDRCVAAHPSDLAPVLVALDATVRLRGRDGERRVAIGEFFALPTDARRTETTARPDEIVVAVEIPRAAVGARGTFLKAMDRKIWAFALASVAVGVVTDGQRVADARIVLGGVAPIPWRAVSAEAALRGQATSAEAIEAAADLALADARPLRHNRYKIPLARSLVRRALAESLRDYLGPS